jgi:hypothetical protein
LTDVFPKDQRHDLHILVKADPPHLSKLRVDLRCTQACAPRARNGCARTMLRPASEVCAYRRGQRGRWLVRVPRSHAMLRGSRGGHQGLD